MPKKTTAAPAKRRANDPELDRPRRKDPTHGGRLPPPPDRLAELHREGDVPGVARFCDELEAMLPDGVLTPADLTDLSALGAGMSKWQRDTLLRILAKAAG